MGKKKYWIKNTQKNIILYTNCLGALWKIYFASDMLKVQVLTESENNLLALSSVYHRPQTQFDVCGRIQSVRKDETVKIILNYI